MNIFTRLTYLKMRMFILITLIIIPINLVFSQWYNLGVHGNDVQMIENQLGVKTFNEPGPTPATGITYNVISTQNDWQSQSNLKTGGGWDYGCCKATNMYFLNTSTGVFTSEYQANNFTLFKTQDSGVNWSVNGSFANCKVKSTCVTSDSISYLALNKNSGSSQLYKLINTSQEIVIDIDSLDFSDVDIKFPNPKTGFVIMNDTNDYSYLFKTNDNGNTWITTFFDAIEIMSITFPDSLTGYMVSKSTNLVHKTTDGGVSWTNMPSPTSSQINSIDFINDTLGYIACNAGEIYKTINGGTDWLYEDSGIPSNIIKIQVVDTNYAYCISENGDLLKNSSLVIDTLNVPFSQINVYPNPSSDFIKIPIQDASKLNDVKFYDQLGSLVLTSNKSNIQISNLKAGMYYVKVSYDQKSKIIKFVKN